ncbi:DNA-directed RNA polymerase I subunit RPA43-like [Hydractinia symbiolongicarpus]|uniref:DNA-directed RNA polymerase I subunit RPA43-like n=1 Tax=Hydractinia symbiolongicarpus TaxID=13093 RepID=UPI00254C0F24|nr:DNA-directed RNA polymerase I subunit RPA43-like [Hydractinia symbiolongicarpus]
MADNHSGKRYNNKHFIKLTYVDAKTLSSHKYSCISEIRHEMKIPMSPKYINNIRLGLTESLCKELFVYNEKMKGIPLAFDNIKVIKSNIIDDQDFFMLTVSVIFLVFNPVIGKILHGTVNKISDHHFGCLIHNCINGSIRHPREDYLTQEQKEIVKNIAVGDKVIFKVHKLDVHHDILFILGDIAQEFYQKVHHNLNSTKPKTEEDVNNNEGSLFKSSCETPKKKKKHDEEERNILTEERDIVYEEENIVNGQNKQKLKRKRTDSSSQSESPSKKKKKKRKKKKKSEEDTD